MTWSPRVRPCASRACRRALPCVLLLGEITSSSTPKRSFDSLEHCLALDRSTCRMSDMHTVQHAVPAPSRVAFGPEPKQEPRHRQPSLCTPSARARRAHTIHACTHCRHGPHPAAAPSRHSRFTSARSRARFTRTPLRYFSWRLSRGALAFGDGEMPSSLHSSYRRCALHGWLAVGRH